MLKLRLYKKCDAEHIVRRIKDESSDDFGEMENKWKLNANT